VDLAEFSHKQGYEPFDLADAWVASYPAITTPIIGARNFDQTNFYKPDEVFNKLVALKV
jgi:aryl-alcohol dehydrogenase-like predicted oxidoreductase